MNQGKEVNSSVSGRKGFEQLRRNFEKQIVENVELRSVAAAWFRQWPKTLRRRSSRDTKPANSTSARCSIHASNLSSRRFRQRSRSFRWWCKPPAASAGPATAYEYEPEEDEILAGLAAAPISRCRSSARCLENNASFYGAQMSAMDNATRNAGDMIRKQTLIYNRTVKR